MPIEGPLHELGMHDVFQLLDLSRKTGVLTVTSARRDSQGHVYFDRGAVTFAAHLFHGEELPDSRATVAVISGGNVEPKLLAEVLSGATPGDT